MIPWWVWLVIGIFVLFILIAIVFSVMFMINILMSGAGNRLVDFRRINIDGFVTVKKIYTDPINKEWKFASNKRGEIMLKQSSWFKNIPIPIDMEDVFQVSDADRDIIVFAGINQYIDEQTKSRLKMKDEKIHNLENELGDLKYQYDIAVAKNLNTTTFEYLQNLAKLHNAVVIYPPKPVKK